MVVTVRDPEVLSNLQPLQVTKYLQSRGWHQDEPQPGDKASFWWLRHEDETYFYIDVPLKTAYRDFPLRMSETLSTLEKAEKRSQLEILYDLFTTATNIEIQGVVIKLQEEVETGKVKMMGCVLGKLRKIYVNLAEPDYNLAIKAYQERIPVVCYGDLSKEGEAFVLKNTSNFALQIEE
ncbi:MAG TPA: hypothetical protein DCE56_25345 [Cyanobacteria bacterium UBA8553]|nr:hypothetical protein [Cyanobacteria bacterium UBA8553]HAJ63847.1 hypothetical protein [Cyanobacteria bacterium UBA8543]